MSRTKFLGRAVFLMGVLTFIGFAAVLFGSLRPSAEADAVYSQGQFPASELADLKPGEIRFVRTGIGDFLVVVPTQELMSDLDLAASYAAYRPYETFDEQLGAFVIWSISPKKRGVPCGVLHMEKDPSREGVAKFGGFFDPCSGVQFDYAGRVSMGSDGNNTRNLKRVEFERVSGNAYQITNLEYLFRGWP